ncbi:DUF2513 domain-containing protein [Bacillus subtilis]|nr:DUF2513 domain-containing protein [Bacillus subtilis]
MILKHDCVRNLLLTIEENVGLNQYVSIDALSKFPRLNSYSLDDISYTVNRLLEADFINAYSGQLEGRTIPIAVESITYTGHLFLDNIREHGIWADTKTFASKVGGASLSILSDIAASIIKSKLEID